MYFMAQAEQMVRTGRACMGCHGMSVSSIAAIQIHMVRHEAIALPASLMSAPSISCLEIDLDLLPRPESLLFRCLHEEVPNGIRVLKSLSEAIGSCTVLTLHIVSSSNNSQFNMLVQSAALVKARACICYMIECK